MSNEMFIAALRAELPRLHRLAVRLAPSGTDPADLVQDVLERAWRARGTFRAEAATATWLHRITVNRARDLATRGNSAVATETEFDDLDESDIGTLHIEDPAAVIVRAEQAQQLRAALTTLPTEARMVVVLHDGEGWSTREIAQICATSVAATQKRLQRARFRLAHALADTSTSVANATPACQATRASVSDYIDEVLPEGERSRIEDHLQRCRRCPPIAQALIGLKEALRSSGLQEPLDADLTRMIDRIRTEE